MLSVMTPLLAMAFTWCLLFERIPWPALIPISLALGVFLAVFCRHKHTNALSIDIHAQTSRLKTVHPMLKFWTVLILLAICIVSPGYFIGVFLLVATLVCAVLVGGISLRNYVRILILPITFLLIGGFALLIEISGEPMGVLSLDVFGFWFNVTAQSQAHTILIISRAFGAVSCLCFLSVTTPMSDLIGVLRKLRCPNIIIDLMYLIYRYIFILLSMHHEMRDAAKSRLGFKNYRTSLRATGTVYSNLFVRSYQFAGKNFDAMESRCYDAGITFLESQNRVSPVQVSICIALLAISTSLSLLPLWVTL